MAAKVAQLTKVILHLHAKGDEPEGDLQEIADAYESEIEAMLTDAADAVNSFKSKLEAQRDDARFDDALGKVQLRYEQERQVRLVLGLV